MTQIQTAILAVMHDIAATGIAKTQRNAQQGYNFRGIEAAMNSLSPLMVKHKIIVTPSYSELTISERFKGDPKDGKAMRFCTVKGLFKFEAEDGSHVTSECYGEAMDSGDKAATKAMSVSFRTAMFQQFVVPTMAIDPESDESEFNDIAQGWIDYCLSQKQDPDTFRQACKDARAAFNQAKDRQGLERFNREVGAV